MPRNNIVYLLAKLFRASWNYFE